MKAYLKFITLAIVAVVLVAECASASSSSSTKSSSGGDGGPRHGGPRRGDCRRGGARKTTLASYNAAINPFFPGNGSAEVQERTDLLIQEVTVHLFFLSMIYCYIKIIISDFG